MSTIVFNAAWEPNSIPTDAASAAIGIVDNTTQTTVVPPGTAMTHVGTGAYSYTYTGTPGHTYVGTMTITGANEAQGVTDQVVYVPASTTVPASNDDGSSSYIAGVWAAQRGLWSNVKSAALAAIATALALGEGPSYSISGRVGSESLSLNEFLSNMRDTAKTATEMEIELTEQLQAVTPFDIRQRVGVGGCRRW